MTPHEPADADHSAADRSAAADYSAAARLDAVDRAAGKDVDGLLTLPGVRSATGDEKAGSGESEPTGTDPALSDVASETYPAHPTFGGPPDRRH